MESELLKLLGTGGSQLILAAGYAPLLWLTRKVWDERSALQQKLIDMLAAKYTDADNAKSLWLAQAKVTEDQTRTISDLKAVIVDLKAQISVLLEDLRRARP